MSPEFAAIDSYEYGCSAIAVDAIEVDAIAVDAIAVDAIAVDAIAVAAIAAIVEFFAEFLGQW